jgi:hypothetical protein
MEPQSSGGIELLVLITLFIVVYFAVCQPKAGDDEADERDA